MRVSLGSETSNLTNNYHKSFKLKSENLTYNSPIICVAWSFLTELSKEDPYLDGSSTEKVPM